MEDDIENGAPEGVAENDIASTDLRSIIENAVDKQREEAPEAPIEAQAKPDGEETLEKPKRADGRDEKGRFASKEGEPAQQAENIEPLAQDGSEAGQLKPPPGWSVSAKAAYGELPESVKLAISRREEEVSKGFARYGGLKQFAEVAEENGTTLAAAVKDYAEIETHLRKDYLSGIDAINTRFGIRPDQFLKAYAARYGVDFGGGQQAQAAYQQPQANLDPNDLINRAVMAVEDRNLRRESMSEIDRFRSDPNNAYFENVRDDMALLLSNGKASDLRDAYEKACWADPEIRAVMLKSQNNTAPSQAAAIQKAKAAAKAVGGAPSPGFNPGAKAPPPNMSIHDNIKAAIAAQRGQI